MPHLIDLTEQRFGRLIVIKRMDNDKWGGSRWLCKCDCGNETIVCGGNLGSGHTKSCSCLSKEGNNTKHGHNKKGKTTQTYRSWHMMIQRCTNPNYTQYKDYGGRGITICERWIKFENFLEDMGERLPGRTLERDKNELGYFKDNCYWATWKQQ